MNLVKEYSQLLFAHPVVGATGTAVIMMVNFMFGTGITRTLGLIFLAVLTLDWLSGRAASRKDGTLASEYGINGAYRSAFMIGIIVLAFRVDVAFGLPYLLYTYFIFNFGLPTWKSMTANVYRAGWERWVPGFVLNRVADEIEHKTARANKRLEEKNKYLEGDTE